MATNNLLPFATASDANLTPENEWQSETLKSVREKGFQSGIAKSAQINRVMAQGAAAGNVLGEISAAYGATDADVGDVETFRAGVIAGIKEIARQTLIDTVYPVGSIYLSTDSTPPSKRFGVGTWERIGAGRTLIDAGGSFAAGTIGGADSHTLTVNEMPAHSHSAQATEAGGHTHTRGSMNIVGGFGAGLYTRYFTQESGAFYANEVPGAKGMDDGNSMKSHYQINFDAARTWVGETSYAGQHGHSVNVGATGGGSAFSVRNPYLAVYIWKRTA